MALRAQQRAAPLSENERELCLMQRAEIESYCYEMAYDPPPAFDPVSCNIIFMLMILH